VRLRGHHLTSVGSLQLEIRSRCHFIPVEEKDRRIFGPRKRNGVAGTHYGHIPRF
jgi:hypothetical protein